MPGTLLKNAVEQPLPRGRGSVNACKHAPTFLSRARQHVSKKCAKGSVTRCSGSATQTEPRPSGSRFFKFLTPSQQAVSRVSQ